MQTGAENDVVVVAPEPGRADPRGIHFLRPEGDGVERVALGGDGADSTLVLELVVDPRQRLLRAFVNLGRKLEKMEM